MQAKFLKLGNGNIHSKSTHLRGVQFYSVTRILSTAIIQLISLPSFTTLIITVQLPH